MSQVSVQDADPDSAEALACLSAYYALLCDNIPGLTSDQLPLPLPDAAAYHPPQGCFLLAMDGARPLGCVSLRPLQGGDAEVKRLWVHPDARGMGLARRLMQAVEDRARQIGYTALRLDSNSALPTAISLYRHSGWHDIPPYTNAPADTWLGKSL